jgi:magnesium-transporting ATPase (P-type)
VVLRDGRQHDIDAADLVPGDVVLLASGDSLPADVRLLQARNLRVDESALTGESVPVDKDTAEPWPPTPRHRRPPVHGLRRHAGHAGPGAGRGRGHRRGHRDRPHRPHARNGRGRHHAAAAQMSVFGRTLTFGDPRRRGAAVRLRHAGARHAAAETFMAAVGLAVAAIPEGLPAIMTITLAIGVQRMARRHAVIRRLPAVETLGSVTVICSDKTGTLTRNEMTVQQVVCAGRRST